MTKNLTAHFIHHVLTDSQIWRISRLWWLENDSQLKQKHHQQSEKSAETKVQARASIPMRCYLKFLCFSPSLPQFFITLTPLFSWVRRLFTRRAQPARTYTPVLALGLLSRSLAACVGVRWWEQTSRQVYSRPSRVKIFRWEHGSVSQKWWNALVLIDYLVMVFRSKVEGQASLENPPGLEKTNSNDNKNNNKQKMRKFQVYWALLLSHVS